MLLEEPKRRLRRLAPAPTPEPELVLPREEVCVQIIYLLYMTLTDCYRSKFLLHPLSLHVGSVQPFLDDMTLVPWTSSVLSVEHTIGSARRFTDLRNLTPSLQHAAGGAMSLFLSYRHRRLS